MFIILVLVVSIPFVQTSLGKYATAKINEDFGTNINIGRVGLQFNGDVELKEIYIEDHHQDTLIAVDELNTSILNFKNIYNGKLVFGDIDIEGLLFEIKTYKDESDTNLDVFVAKFDDDEPRKEKSTFLLSSGDVTIEDGTFRITDENSENPHKMNFKKFKARLKDFRIEGPEVSTTIKALSFMSGRGAELKNLSTQFKYTLSGMTFGDLTIETDESKIIGDLEFAYDREDLKEFLDKVRLKATFRESAIAFNDLNHFYNEFGENRLANFSADCSGTLNDLQVNNLKLNTTGNTRVNGNFNFKNLFGAEEDNFLMIGQFDNLSSNYNDLTNLLPNILGPSIPDAIKNFGYFNAKGRTQITAQSILANNTISTGIGLIKVDLKMDNIDDIDNAAYRGVLVLNEFDLGKFLGNKDLGSISMNMNLVGSGFKLETLNTEAQGNISSLDYNNYKYSSIDVSGQFQNNKFMGKFDCDDDNLKLEFDGLADLSEIKNIYDFKANVLYANLKELHFVDRDSISVFKGLVDMKMKGTNINDVIGDVTFNNTVYQNQNDSYYFKDFKLTSSFNDKDVRLIEINSPDIIEGRLRGKFLFEDLGRLLENAIGSIYTNYEPKEVTKNQYIAFNFKIYNKIVEVFYPNIHLGKNTFIRGRVENDKNDFKLTFKSPQIKLFEYFADNIQVNVDNKNPLFNTYVKVDSLNTKLYNISKFNLINVTLKDTLFMRSEFKGGKHNKDVYNLSLYYTINEDNKSVLGFKKSDIIFKNNTWVINENRDRHNRIIFDRGMTDVEFDRLLMNNKDEKINLSGSMKQGGNKDIRLDFKNVELSEITPEIDSLRLEGIVNGRFNVFQKEGVYLPNSTLTIKDFKANDTYLGSFNAAVTGNQSLTNYLIDITIQDDIKRSFSARGNLDVSEANQVIDLDIALNEFDLKPLNPLGQDVISNIRGLVTGNASVSGKLNRPSINGSLRMEQTGLRIPYLNVDYEFQDNAEVTLEDQSFIFRNIDITDSKFNSNAKLSGNISHVNFSDWSLDLNIVTDKLLVLNTKFDEDALYYGTAFIGGQASIMGPTDELVIKVDGQSREGTVLKIPLNDAESFGDNSYIHFLSKDEKESKLSGKELVFREIKGLELDFDLDVNEDAEVEIIIDPDSGHSLKGRGAGNLLIEINTNGKFNMWGDFLTFEGVYNFIYGGLIQKQFIVQPGGTITWDGDPLKAQINIQAIYNARANPTPLLDNPVTKSIPVNVIVDLTGELELLEPNFSFEFPSVASNIKSELEYRLNSKEERDNQALYLLATGAFSRGLNDLSTSSSIAAGTIAERLNSIVNNLFSDSDGKFNLGVNYEIGEKRPDYETDDRVGFTLQTQISDRVMINGQVGIPVGGVSQTAVAGDVQIDFLLNEEGTLRAKVFNRENSIRNFGEEIGYTQGIGISYNVDFDTFKELLSKILKGKLKGKRLMLEQKDSTNTESYLPKFVNFKSTEQN